MKQLFIYLLVGILLCYLPGEANSADPQCAAGQLKCPPIDLVFIMDTSGSMVDEGSSLCSVLSNVVTTLRNVSVIVQRQATMGITRPNLPGATCIKTSVYPRFGDNPSVGNEQCPFPDADNADSLESWGPATSIVAHSYNWIKGAVRVIVPISDEGPCQGDPVNALDYSTIVNAINQANINNVIVSPILGSIQGTDEDQTPEEAQAAYALVGFLMNQIANATNGIAAQTTGSLATPSQMSNNILRIVKAACVFAPPPCSDNNLCTTNDMCDVNGNCVGTRIQCPTGQTCDPRDGQCKACRSNSDCEDNDPCTINTCDVASGRCSFPQKQCPNGQRCDSKDGNCKQCVINADCNDGQGCTTDTCVAGACQYYPKCPAGQQCDPVTSQCRGCLSAADCNDGNNCTTDNCNANGQCTNTPINCPPDSPCDPMTGKCARCASDGDCKGGKCSTGLCNTITGACTYVPTCPAGKLCQADTGLCVDCRIDNDCDVGLNLCQIGYCSADGKCTRQDRQCPYPLQCNISTGACSITLTNGGSQCQSGKAITKNTASLLFLNYTGPGNNLSAIISRVPERGTLYQYVNYTHTAGTHLPACNVSGAISALNFTNYRYTVMVPTNSRPIWQVTANGLNVTQTLPGAPPSALIYPDARQNVYEISGSLMFTADQSGYIGIIFGYRSASQFFLIDIKQTTDQDGNQGVSIKQFVTQPQQLVDLASPPVNQILLQDPTFVPQSYITYNYILTVDTLGGYLQFDLFAANGNGRAISMTYSGHLIQSAYGYFGVYDAKNSGAFFSNPGVCSTTNPQIVTNGYVVTDPLRRVIYMPARNIYGSVNGFDYIFYDGFTYYSRCTQTFNILNTPDVPVAFPATYTVSSGVPSVTVSFLGTSIDSPETTAYIQNQGANGTLYQCIPQSDGTCAQGAMVPLNGMLTDQKDRAVYVPKTGVIGQPVDVINFVVKDGNGSANSTLSVPATVTINIVPAGSPLATLGPQVTNQNTPLTMTLTSNNTTPGVPVQYNLIQTVPSQTGYLQITNPDGSVTNLTGGAVVPNGVIRYIPTPGFNDDNAVNYGGKPFFIYSVTNGPLTSPGQSVPISVRPIGSGPPTAIPPPPFYTSGNPILIGVEGESPDNKPLTLCLSSLPTGGTLNQVIRNGTNQFSVGAPIRATPVAINSTSNPNCILVNENSHAPNSPYTISYFYYTPNGTTPAGCPADNTTYSYTDGSQQSNTVGATFCITPTLRRPIAQGLTPSNTMADTPQIITLNGTDADGNPTPLTYYITQACKQGTLYQVINGNQRGNAINITNAPVQVTDPAARVMFVPVGAGTPYCTVTFYVQDQKNLTSPAKDNLLSVNKTNHPPNAIDSNLQTPQDTDLTVTLKGTDQDTGDNLTYTVASAPSKGTLYQYQPGVANNRGPQITSVPTMVTDPQGRVVFVPNKGEYGTSTVNGVPNYYTAFTFNVMDQLNATSPKPGNIQIGVVRNQFNGPTPNPTQIQTTEDVPKCINLTAVPDPGVASPLTFYLLSLPARYSGTVSRNPGGAVITSSDLANGGYVLPKGQICYTPAQGYNDDKSRSLGGIPSFVFSVGDEHVRSKPANVPIYVAPVNHPPTVVRPSDFSTTPGTAIPITLYGTDPDNDPITFCIIPNSGGVSGALYTDSALQNPFLLGGSSSCTPLPNSVHSPANQPGSSVTFYYQPPANAVPASPYDFFTFQGSDGRGGVSNIEPININVVLNKTAPTAIPQTVSTPQDTSLPIILNATDPFNPQQALQYYVTSPCKNGTLFQMLPDGSKGPAIDPSSGPVAVSNTMNEILFVPRPGESGSPYCPFTFYAQNPSTGKQSPSVPVQVTVTPVNSPPVALPLTIQTSENISVPTQLGGTPAPGLNCSITTPVTAGKIYQYDSSQPQNKGAQITGPGTTQLTDPQCRIVFEPTPGTYGTNNSQGVNGYYGNFNYTVTSPTSPNPSAPVNVPIGVTRATFLGPQPDLPPQVTNQSVPLPMTLTAKPNLPFPVTGYTLSSIPPDYSGYLTFPGSNTPIRQSQLPLNVPNGSLIYVPNPSYTDIVGNQLGGLANFDYTASDKNAQSPLWNVPISVRPQNQPPVAIPPPLQTIPQGQATPLTLCGTDPQNGPLYVCLKTNPTKGQLRTYEGVEYGTTIIPDANSCVNIRDKDTTHQNGSSQTCGKLYYLPTVTGTGPDSFTFTVKQQPGTPGLESTPATQNINLVPGVPDPPTPGPVDPPVTPQDTPITIPLKGIEPNDPAGPETIKSPIYVSSPCRPNTLFQVNADGSRGAPINPTANKPVRVTNQNGQIMLVPIRGTSGANYCNFGFFVQSPNTSLNSSQLLVPVTVTPIGARPTAIPTKAQTKVNTSVPLTLQGAVIGIPSSNLSSYVVSMPSKGKLYQYDPNSPGNKGQPITGASNANPVLVTSPTKKVVFDPAPGEVGRGNLQGVRNYYTTFNFIVRTSLLNNTKGMSSDPASAVVGVDPVELPPVPTLNNITTNENTNKSFYLTATDPDTPQSQLSYALIDLPQRGQLYNYPANDSSNPHLVKLGVGPGGRVQPVSVPAGRLVYVPPRDQASQGPPYKPLADFTYTVNDGTFTVPKKVQIYVIPVGIAPTPTSPDDLNIPEDRIFNPYNLTSIDPNTPPNGLTYIITKLPTKGSLEQPNNVPIDTVGTKVIPLIDDKTGNPQPFDSLFYIQPTPNVNGPKYDTFEYVAVDPSGVRSPPKTVTINIAPIADKPTARVLSLPSVAEAAPFLLISLGGDDPDISTNNDSLIAYVTKGTRNGNLYQVNPRTMMPDTSLPISSVGNVTTRVNILRTTPNMAGAVAYVHKKGIAGYGIDDMTFYVQDTFGIKSSPLNFKIDVIPTHSVPIAGGVPNLVHVYDNPVTITLPAAGDKGDNLTRIITNFPPTGQLLNTDGSRIDQSNPRVKDPSGKVVYNPSKTSSGPSSFAYKVVDNTNGLSSVPTVVRMELSPTTIADGTPLVRYTDPYWYVVQNNASKVAARKQANFTVTATDTNNDPLSIVFTNIPDPSNGVVTYKGRNIGADIDPKCQCIIIPASGVNRNGSSSWNFVYQATNNTGVDSVTFSVVDRQINSPADYANYPSYNIALDANKSGKTGTGSTQNGSGSGDGHSGLPGYAIALIVLACVCCCLICIVCIVVAVVLVARKAAGGAMPRRKNARKPLNDQQYENLGSYSPPDL